MLTSALFITWCLLSRVDFLYPTFHQVLDINETVSKFGPKNRYRDGFETTTEDQHYVYFSDIVTAINNDGKGLSDIRYPYQGEKIPLLRKASSLKRLLSKSELYLVNVKYFLLGLKDILVPVNSVFPSSFKGATGLLFLYSCVCTIPFLYIVSSNVSERALTTDTPTP